VTDSEYRKQKARILKSFNRWAGPTGMKEFIVNHHFHREGLEPGNPEDARNGYVCFGRADVKWQYLTADFHWNVRDLVDLPDHVVDRNVRHEIAHALVHEMREFASDSDAESKLAHEDRVVTKLAFVFNWCREAGAREAKRAHKPAVKGKRKR